MKFGEGVFGHVKEDNPVVFTDKGPVVGEKRGNVSIFRGIPYGKDTTGYRFLAPEEPDPWTEIRDCTRNGNICWQTGTSININPDEGAHFSGQHPERFGADTEVMSEDCLVVNVVTPGIDDNRRAVLFYIHGGGYAEGTGTLAIGTDDFVNEQDVVVVSLNHRLNLFGYMYLGDFDPKYKSSGVSGILDIVLALKWVQKNITAFGGDPKKVSIMGESGGGGKVSTLLAMEAAKGLFRGAVVESGSMPVATVSRFEGTQLVKDFLKAGGYDENDWQKLLTLPAARLLEIMKSTSFRISPVADDIYLNYNADGLHHSAVPAEGVTIVVGCSEDELAGKRKKELYTATEENLRDELLKPQRTFGPMHIQLCTEDNVDAVLDVLYRTREKNQDANHLMNRVISIASFGSAVAQMRAEASNKNRKKPMYAYLVAYDSQHPMYPDAQGMKYSWHTADLPMQLRIVLNPESDKMSRTMANHMGAFLRTGNPSSEDMEWPPYTIEERKTMVFDDVCKIEREPLADLYKAFYNK